MYYLYVSNGGGVGSEQFVRSFVNFSDAKAAAISRTEETGNLHLVHTPVFSARRFNESTRVGGGDGSCTTVVATGGLVMVEKSALLQMTENDY